MNLRELAESLGLSQTTVSRALNGYPEVREETRARVLAAARAANYAPNSRAQRLATGRAMTIGHVIPLSGKTEMMNPIFNDFLTGAGETYSREGYDMLLKIVGDNEAEEAYRTLVSNGSVDGVLVQGPQSHDPRVAFLQSLGIPFLVHGRTADPTGYSWLDVANIRSFRRATDFLLDLGHTRIALVNGQDGFDFSRRRQRGYEDAHAARDLEVDPSLISGAVMTEGYGHSAATALLEREDAPTAFLVSSVIPAIGVRRAVGERGLKLGRDISLVCFDDVLSYLTNDDQGLGFTATRSSIRDAGRRCAEILIELIRNPDTGPIQELWETELTVGRSTGPCPT